MLTDLGDTGCEALHRESAFQDFVGRLSASAARPLKRASSCYERRADGAPHSAARQTLISSCEEMQFEPSKGSRAGKLSGVLPTASLWFVIVTS